MTAPIDYQAVLLDLKARRRQLDAAITSIESILAAAGVPVEPDDRDFDAGLAIEPPVPPLATAKTRQPAGAVNGVSIQNDTFFSLSTPEAIRKFLGMMKRPQKVADIARALMDGGQIHARDATTAYNNVYAALKRMRKAGEGVRIKSGEWALAEWYSSAKPKADVE